MNKKIKRIITSTILCVGLFTTTAFAQSQSTNEFTYGSFTAKGTLNVDWNLIGNDYGSARTDRISIQDSAYKVTSYLEAQDGTDAVSNETAWDTGYTWAQSDIARAGVWRFNSTHGIAYSSNVYVAKTYRTLTDW